MDVKRCFIQLSVIMLLLGCQSKENSTHLNDSTSPEVSSEVQVQTLKTSVFHQEIISNGVLSAANKSDLRFKVSETLEKVFVRNGQFVRAGQPLAELHTFELQQELLKAKSDLQKAQFDLEDELIGRGYEMGDSLPDNLQQMVNIRSGYAEAVRELATRKYRLDQATLKAPYDGIVANVGFQQFDQINEGDIFCKLIDPTTFEVEFYLLESEVALIGLNDVVEVTGFDKKKYMGTIQSINPLVEENGMILIKALIRNNGALIEGMNVRIKVLKDIEDQWVVPKSAILLRQDESVLFKYSQGRAKWVYVETVMENSQKYAVKIDETRSSEDLFEGDTVIISNNLNLAHDSRVTIKSTQINP